jgi:hypothetical protein
MKFWVDLGDDSASAKPKGNLEKREEKGGKQDLVIPKPKSEGNANKQTQAVSGKNAASSKPESSKKGSKEDKASSQAVFIIDAGNDTE